MTPKINVGIVSATHITLHINGPYICNIPVDLTVPLEIDTDTSGVTCNGITAPGIQLTPKTDGSTITISDVAIGIDFHWARNEDQSFQGIIRIIPADGKLQVINTIDIEKYLRSVVSSEMNANAPEEFLKAHAVISRSWVLAQINPPGHTDGHQCTETDDELVRWYDRDGHTLFDVCADDHCQRYQGCTKATTSQVTAALKSTRGQVLTYKGTLCDARFSKCCGGITELFSTCWQPVDVPYLQAIADTTASAELPDLTDEAEANNWIDSRPDAFCANPSKEVLNTVLNNYDLETTDFYRWQVEYTGTELAALIRRRTGLDYGKILSLTPLHRGPSGRIDRLEITGTKRHRIIGKELEIRRTLSDSHLYSSAFTVEASMPDSDGIPTRWRLNGAGWGHGVGLCQIGAAVMASKGYNYRQILSHYFPGAAITELY